jgi:hypothetical protein
MDKNKIPWLLLGLLLISLLVWGLVKYWPTPEKVIAQIVEIQDLLEAPFIVQVKVEKTTSITFPERGGVPVAKRNSIYIVHTSGTVFVDPHQLQPENVVFSKGKIFVTLPPLSLMAKPEPRLSTAETDIELEWWVDTLVGLTVDQIGGAVLGPLLVELADTIGENAPDAIVDFATSLLESEVKDNMVNVLKDLSIEDQEAILEEARTTALDHEHMCFPEYTAYYVNRYQEILETQLEAYYPFDVVVEMQGVNCP